MRSILIFVASLLLVVMFVQCQEETPDVKLELSIFPEEGWMNGGYGSLKFKFINNSDSPLLTGAITGIWNVGGQTYNNWEYFPKLKLAQGEENVATFICWMPPQTEGLAKSSVPQIKGNAKVLIGKEELVIPFSVEVPVAQLPTPLHSQKGKYIELILQEKTWEKVKNPEKIVNYLDDVYAEMYELTGRRPFQGDMMALQECPRNPYFAYAGNPIILNGAYVAYSIANFDNDKVDFGWVHQIGLNFDNVIGNLYNHGSFSSCQANLKLSYALEELCTEESKFYIRSFVDKKTMLTGKAFNDEYFASFGPKYLNDTTRTWESLRSDEYHALFYTVICKHGWDVMKKYYRIYGQLSDNGIKTPRTAERSFLAFTVLDKCCDENLVPLYKKWRIPVDAEKIEIISKKYHLDSL